MFGWRPISEVRKLARDFLTRATRWLYLGSGPHVDGELFPFNTNHHLYRRFVYLQGTSGETVGFIIATHWGPTQTFSKSLLL